MIDNTTSEPREPQGKRERTERAMPVVEEELAVGKKVVESGRVRVHKTVHERELVIDPPLYADEIDVERVSVNKYVESAPAAHYEGDVFVIPVVEEVVVRMLRVREEIRLRRRRRERHEPQIHTVRYEQARVERVAPGSRSAAGGTGEREPARD